MAATTPVMFTVKTLYGIDVRRFDINMHEQAVVDPFTQLTSLIAVAYTLPQASILLKVHTTTMLLLIITSPIVMLTNGLALPIIVS